MIETTISEAFDYFPGNHGLTEETIYNYKPTSSDMCIPIYSGSQNNIIPIGYIRENGLNKKGEKISYFIGPCLILTKDGSAGLLTFKSKNDGVFTINHHACVLKAKKKWKNKIDLKWFSLQYQDRLLQYVTSRSDNMVFSTEWFDRIVFNIPSPARQVKQKKMKLKLLNYAKFLNNASINIDRNLLHKKLKIEANQERINDVFHIKGGNSGLTEEFIYNNAPSSEDDKIDILSGATITSNLLGSISKKAKPKGKELKIFYGPSILVVRKGLAGKMSLLKNEIFTTNDDAYVLIPKKKWLKKINLRWFIFQYQELFFNVVSSKSDNATFNKEYTKKQFIFMPYITYQNDIACSLNKIDNLQSNLNSFKNKAINLGKRPFFS